VGQSILEGPVAGYVGESVHREGIEGLSGLIRSPNPEGECGRTRDHGGGYKEQLAQRKGSLLQPGAKSEQGGQGEEKDRQSDLESKTNPAEMEV
jgi:hypothetical protein